MYALVDCNNFYVSCERVFQPQYRGKPVVVLSNNDGCAIARSEEAKAIGIDMGAPIHFMEHIIREHRVKLFSSNYTLYGDMSARVMQVLSSFAEQIENYSIDESFLYLGDIRYEGLEKLALRLKKRVYQYTGIPVTIGIAPSKTLAKLANRYAKKKYREKGVYALDTNEKIIDLLQWADVGDIWGIGAQLDKKLRQLGINTAYELSLVNEEWVRKNMTVKGQRLVNELRGIACIPLEEQPPPKKGICTSRSFGTLITEKDTLKEAVANHASKCALKLRKQNSCAGLMQVFVATNQFRTQDRQYHRQITIELPMATSSSFILSGQAMKAIDLLYKENYNYHKAGVIVMEIVPDNQVQGALFEETNREKEEKLMTAMDGINQYLGTEIVKLGRQGSKKKWKLRAEYLSSCYTTRLSEILRVG